ncbi:Alpha/Beta hydrolase protein [Pterulicium gracile]|uniref:Alpha/Beta hydrolase protein n=1 Tax=Pterulicium gracile TaxID=1884261 RepID=A0A5C3R292_9AGAR|nr:Alpha/Beta hydrolase protein [Pterula gracilis]
MDGSSYKSLVTPRGYMYGYYHQSPSENDHSKPSILFLHGFPSTSKDWSAQVSHFTKQGYGVLAPDLLGYGKTEKPVDRKEYKTIDIVDDVVAILDKERLEKNTHVTPKHATKDFVTKGERFEPQAMVSIQ